MKRVLLYAAVVMMTGCAAQQSTQMAEFDQHIRTNLPRAMAGDVKWSAYYNELYARAMAAQMPAATLQRINESILNAQLLEAGKMSQDEFQFRRRSMQTAELAQNQAADEQRKQDGARLMAVGTKIVADSQPRPAGQ